jgi:hypothetical protein
VLKELAALAEPLAMLGNPAMKILLPAVEPIYLAMLKVTEPLMDPVSRKLMDWVAAADPATFERKG